MRRAALIVVLLGGCSLAATRARPQSERSGTRLSCGSYVYPTLDTVAAVVGIAAGGFLATLNADLHRGGHQGAGLHGYGQAGLFLAFGFASAVSAQTGFSRNGRCSDALDRSR